MQCYKGHCVGAQNNGSLESIMVFEVFKDVFVIFIDFPRFKDFCQLFIICLIWCLNILEEAYLLKNIFWVDFFPENCIIRFIHKNSKRELLETVVSFTVVYILLRFYYLFWKYYQIIELSLKIFSFTGSLSFIILH